MHKYFQMIKTAKKKIQNPFFRAKANYIKYYETLPLDAKTVLLESQQGTQINGNIFYLLQYLTSHEEFSGYKFYISSWGRHMQRIKSILEFHEIKNVTVVLYVSDEYFRLLATAKYLFNDNTFLPLYIKKKGQIYINTWHGTPLKTLGRKQNTGKGGIGNAQKNFVVTDYFLFPNQQTRDAIIRDYMVENLTNAVEIFSGYPRNTIFFDRDRQNEIRSLINPDNKRLYAYMPTFRGNPGKGGTAKSDIYLRYYLYELDQMLNDEEILYVNLHPVVQKSLDYREFKHIRSFLPEYETYEFLSACDVLITDYSSVFFDYAVSGKKIVLFPFDEEEYLSDRGTYAPFSSLPFPKAYDLIHLLEELRSSKNYEDSEFLNKYCLYESEQATARLCNLVFFNAKEGLTLREPKHNEKENVIIYAGNLSENGITRALTNLLKSVDLNARNYFITFKSTKVDEQAELLKDCPEALSFFPMRGDMCLTLKDRTVRKLFKEGILSASSYIKINGKRIRQNWLRCFGTLDFSKAIHFSGYENELILMWSLFPGEKAIFVHSDMKKEIEIRGNQRKDVLEYAYGKFNVVVPVTEDIVDVTVSLAKKRDHIKVARNMIPIERIKEKADEDIVLNDDTTVYPTRESFFQAIDSPVKRYISVGRFSPEKGHQRLVSAFKRFRETHPDSHLIIMGGSSYKGSYKELVKYIEDMDMSEYVTLLMKVSNPYPIIKACDSFILSSFYEGFGLVLAEADILGLPVVSTDITGPRTFMLENGGTLVENSEDGIYNGLCLLYDGKVKRMSVDYETYNQEAVEEFESLFSGNDIRSTMFIE